MSRKVFRAKDMIRLTVVDTMRVNDGNRKKQGRVVVDTHTTTVPLGKLCTESVSW